MPLVYTSPKFEFHECKLTFSYDVKAAKWMHQENPELFLWVKMSSIKCVAASSIYGRELAIHENQADLYESRSTEKKKYNY